MQRLLRDISGGYFMRLFGNKDKEANKNKNASRKKPTGVITGEKEITVTIPEEAIPLINTATATHIGTRDYQQDAAYVCEPLYKEGLAFGILCDGMGGTAEGERASSETIIFIANRIAGLGENDNIQAFLEQAAFDVNDLILEQNEQAQLNSGTTLVTVLMRDGLLYWLSIGDSRIYIIRDGDMVQITTDHNFALELQEKVDSGLLQQEEADNDPRKEHLISYIGAPYLERIDINRFPFELQSDDIILLCSDGLTKSLYTDEIFNIITRCGRNIAEAARLLPIEAFNQSPNALDNTTVILMQYLGKPSEQTGFADIE